MIPGLLELLQHKLHNPDPPGTDVTKTTRDTPTAIPTHMIKYKAHELMLHSSEVQRVDLYR